MKPYFPPLISDDPRLTAFALGELSAEENAFVEKAVTANPELAAQVEEIRESVRLLEETLSSEFGETREQAPLQASPVPLPAAAAAPEPSRAPTRLRGDPPSYLRFPQLYFVIGGMAAAGFAVLVALRPEPKRPVPLAASGAGVRQPISLPYAATEAAPEPEVALSQQPAPALEVPHLDAQPAAADTPFPTDARFRIAAKKQLVFGASRSASGSTFGRASAAKYIQSPGSSLQGLGRVAKGGSYAMTPLAAADAQLRRVGLHVGAPNTETRDALVSASARPAVSLALAAHPESFALLKREILEGTLPDPRAIDVGAILSSYEFKEPEISLDAIGRGRPFSVSMEVARAPWNSAHRLARIDVRARAAQTDETFPRTVARTPSAELEFNPQTVASYRVLGYNETLGGVPRAETDLQPSQRVTYLVELALAEGALSAGPGGLKLAALQGKSQEPVSAAEEGRPLFTFTVNWVDPKSDKPLSELHVVKDAGADWSRSSADFKFAASLGAYGMLLRQAPDLGSADFSSVEHWAEQGVGAGNNEERRSFIELVRKTRQIAK